MIVLKGEGRGEESTQAEKMKKFQSLMKKQQAGGLYYLEPEGGAGAGEAAAR